MADRNSSAIQKKRLSVKVLVKNGIALKDALQKIGLSKSTFYATPKNGVRKKRSTKALNPALVKKLHEIIKKEHVGYKKIGKKLRLQGFNFSDKVVLRHMKQLNMLGISKRAGEHLKVAKVIKKEAPRQSKARKGKEFRQGIIMRDGVPIKVESDPGVLVKKI